MKTLKILYVIAMAAICCACGCRIDVDMLQCEFLTNPVAIDNTQPELSWMMGSAIYGGNSGGGLFNSKGELIGIANAGNVTDQNINFAVPLQIVENVASNIMYHYADGDDSTNGVYKITLGVGVKGQNSKYEYDKTSGYGRIREEVLVGIVNSGSISEAMGLQVGDILKAIVIDGERLELDRYFRIGDYTLSLRAGMQFAFEYERAGEIHTSQTHTVSFSDLVSVA